ncbi:MAG: ornithine cyclodeaminase family protein [Deltaproteobacteria bacterium]|nr:ornithine cyclodeaminase family protein [Deltaproteobacteria bacterium]
MRTGILSEADVLQLVNPRDAYDAVVHAHQALSRGEAVNSIRLRARSDAMSLHTMSALDRSRNYAGSKIYSAFGRMVACHFLLYRVSNGELLTMIEAKELGRLRTAAANTAALRALHPGTVETIGIIGTGYQAEGLARSLAAFRTEIGFRRVLVHSRTPASMTSFISSVTKQHGLELEPVSSCQELCERSDAIFTATNSMSPVVEHDWLKRTKVICAFGANALIRRELSPRVVTSAKLVVVDETEVAKCEGGNLLPAIETGRLQWRMVWELGAVLCGRHLPEGESGYIVFCSHGLAVQDLALASVVYERALGQGRIKAPTDA